jgi:hypothetical protein
MTISTDLATRTGIRRRYFLKIDGVEPYIFQPTSVGESIGADIESHPNAGSIGHWMMDESLHTDDLIDSSGNGLTANVGGNPTTTTGKIRGARDFAPAAEESGPRYGHVSGDLKMKVQDFSVMGWFFVDMSKYTATYEGNEAIGPLFNLRVDAVGEGPNAEIRISTRKEEGEGPPTLEFVTVRINFGLYLDFTSTIVEFESENRIYPGWHHFAVTWDGTTIILYLDGEEDHRTIYTNEGDLLTDCYFDWGAWSDAQFLNNAFIDMGGDSPEMGMLRYSPHPIDDVILYGEAKTEGWIETWCTVRSINENAWSRSVKACLNPPTELSIAINPAECTSEISQMTFELLDIKDDDGTSYWGKMFAPARWDANKHWRIKAATAEGTYLAANSDAINIETGVGITSNGMYHIGIEAFGFTGYDEPNKRLTGVTKGIYPCSGAAEWGYAYYIPLVTEGDYRPYVGEVPFAMMGKRIALYVATYDPLTGLMHSESDCINQGPLWIGRISDSISFDPRLGIWKLSCISILDDLKKMVGNRMPETELSNTINLPWQYGGNVLKIKEYLSLGPTHKATATITFTPGVYHNVINALTGVSSVTPYTFDSEVNRAFENMVWVDEPGSDHSLEIKLEEDKLTIKTKKAGRYAVIEPVDDKMPCIWLTAMGLDIPAVKTEYSGTDTTPDEDGYYTAEIERSIKWIAFHPIAPLLNGGKMYVKNNEKLWNDQGDDSSPRAWVIVENIHRNGSDDKQSHYARYLGKGFDNYQESQTSNWETHYYLTLDSSYVLPDDLTATAFIGRKKDESDPSVIRNIYVPTRKPLTAPIRGPFELLLFPLLSTGTTNYNHATYDKLFPDLGIAMDSTLVDVDSFLDADKEFSSDPLADRSFYPIAKPLAFETLLKRECMLFGKILTWNRGKLRLKNITAPSTETQTVQLDDTNNANPYETPEMIMSADTIVNQYECKLDYDPKTDKWGPPTIISDMDSKNIQITKQVTLEHPGIYFDSRANLAELLRNRLQGRIFRYAAPIIKRTLAPILINRVYPGDVVKFVSKTVPDPLGTGSMNTSTYALVLEKSWNYKTETGSCTLMLLSAYGTWGLPWAPAAVLNKSAPNNGWDSAMNALELSPLHYGIAGDRDDGAAFHAGDKVMIYERCPSDPLSGGELMGPCIVAYEYETNGAQLLTLVEDIGPINTAREYFVTYSYYSDIQESQKLNGVWLANMYDYTLPVNVAPYRWG